MQIMDEMMADAPSLAHARGRQNNGARHGIEAHGLRDIIHEMKAGMVKDIGPTGVLKLCRACRKNPGCLIGER